MRAAAKQAQPISAPDSVLFFSLLMREQNVGANKVIKPSMRVKRVCRASCNKMTKHFHRKIRHFCLNNFPLCPRMADSHLNEKSFE